MNSDGGEGDLRYFVERFLASRGAALEKAAGCFEVLFPGELAERLSVSEYATLNFTGDAPGEVAVQYGSPFLEKMAELACRSVPVTGLKVQFHYLKSQGFDRLAGETFRFPNAVAGIEKSAETLTDYLLLTCRYLLQSDEQKEGLVTMGFHLETGAPVEGMEGVLHTLDWTADGERAPMAPDTLERVVGWVERRVKTALLPHLGPFEESMNRRFRRDVASLDAYYASLEAEMRESLTRPGLSEDSIAERMEKIGLLSQELAVKKEDLLKKYGIQVRVGLSAAMILRTPAVKVLMTAAVGRDKRQLTLFYNPIAKALDPLVCAGCGEGTYQVQFCRRLHLLCPRCGQKCPVCG